MTGTLVSVCRRAWAGTNSGASPRSCDLVGFFGVVFLLFSNFCRGTNAGASPLSFDLTELAGSILLEGRRSVCMGMNSGASARSCDLMGWSVEVVWRCIYVTARALRRWNGLLGTNSLASAQKVKVADMVMDEVALVCRMVLRVQGLKVSVGLACTGERQWSSMSIL